MTIWHGVSAVSPPEMQHVLLVDDNDFYAGKLTRSLQSHSNAKVTRVISAQAAIALLQVHPDIYDGVVTDMSMETELAGLKVLAFCKKIQFSGTVAVATTALDTAWAFFINQWLFAWYGADYLIPKRFIKKRQGVIWLPSKKNYGLHTNQPSD